MHRRFEQQLIRNSDIDLECTRRLSGRRACIQDLAFAAEIEYHSNRQLSQGGRAVTSGTETLASLGDTDREALKLLLDGLDEHWSLEGLTTLVYAVPKLQAGLTADAKPTAELKAAQRSFFALLYKLLVGRDTGPRLPTLLLAVGADKVRELLGAS